MSLRSVLNRETFHPVTGPAVEAQVLHVDQQRLAQRSAAIDNFVVWDVGLGAAANALAAVKALQKSEHTVHLHSFDKTTLPLQFAIKHAADLKYLVGFEKLLEQLIEKQFVQITPTFSWYFHQGNFSDSLNDPNLSSPHSILYDPYSATTNIEMWTQEHFTKLFSKLSPTVPCLLSNYTRSTSVRISMLLAGFAVGVGCGIGEKEETTVASNSFELLEKPLNRKWLDRVRISEKSAPLRAKPAATGASQIISGEDLDRLHALPQFC